MLLKERDGPSFSFVSTRAGRRARARRPGGGAPPAHRCPGHARGMPGACRALPPPFGKLRLQNISHTIGPLWEDVSWLIGRALLHSCSKRPLRFNRASRHPRSRHSATASERLHTDARSRREATSVLTDISYRSTPLGKFPDDLLARLQTLTTARTCSRQRAPAPLLLAGMP